jgi:hypothetical protein
MIKRLEKIISGLMIGGTFPLLFGLLSVIVWYYLDKLESRAIIYLAAGLIFGLIIDLIFLKGWINRRFELPLWSMAGIYILYNVFVFGFFMGFPVFNVLLGLIAGNYFGNRIVAGKLPSEIQSKQIKQVSIFTALIMALICISSAVIGLTDEYTGANIQGMLRLDFEVTQPMLWAIALVGGLSMIIVQYVITKWTIQKTIKLKH